MTITTSTTRISVLSDSTVKITPGAIEVVSASGRTIATVNPGNNVSILPDGGDSSALMVSVGHEIQRLSERGRGLNFGEHQALARIKRKLRSFNITTGVFAAE